jgi:hypothetical protein
VLMASVKSNRCDCFLKPKATVCSCYQNVVIVQLAFFKHYFRKLFSFRSHFGNDGTLVSFSGCNCCIAPASRSPATTRNLSRDCEKFRSGIGG